MPNRSEIFKLSERKLIGKLLYTDRGGVEITNIVIPIMKNVLVISKDDLSITEINFYESKIPVLAGDYSYYKGQPILAVENITDYFPIPCEMMPNAPAFMLKVKGDSMINAGILDGDEIIVKQQSDADNGDYVVALIDDSVTVKTFYKEDGHIRLQPENDSMDPFIFEDVQILGKVIGVFRMFK